MYRSSRRLELALAEIEMVVAAQLQIFHFIDILNINYECHLNTKRKHLRAFPLHAV